MIRIHGFISALFTATMLVGCGGAPESVEEPIRPIKIHEIGTGTWEALAQGREFPGTVRASQRVDLSFRFPGRLTELLVEEGQPVRRGDVIARLDLRDLESRRAQIASELDRAEALLRQMRAGARAEDVRRLESLLESRRAEADLATLQLERMRTLLGQGAIAQQEFDKAQTQADVALAAVDSVVAELTVATSGARDEEVTQQEALIRGIQARLDEAENAIEDAVLRAPFDGVIAQKLVENFQDVQALQPIVRLHDLSRLHILINVTEADMGRGAQEGPRLIAEQQVVAYGTFPAIPGLEVPLRAREVQTEADPGTQTFAVRLEMEQVFPFAVKPGMNVVVRSLGINSDREGPGIHIPVAALIGGTGGAAVWVVDGSTGRVKKRDVQTGDVHQNLVRITGGLSAGERIATSAVNMLREGMQVKPMIDPREL